MSEAPSARLRRETAPSPDSGGFWNGRRLGEVRTRLEQRRRALEGALRDDRERASVERSDSAPADAADSAEAAAAEWLIDVDSATTSRDLRELAEVDAALERLNAGRYGVCVACGASISPVRLIYAPQAARCLACQERVQPGGHRAR